MGTKIEWTDETWNPIRYLDGWMCTKKSAGCENCYAESFNKRFGNKLPYRGPNKLIGFHLDKKHLNKPLHWRKPRRIFVQSMGDLFHEDVPFEFIDEVLETTRRADWHTYLILTKRIERAVEWANSKRPPGGILQHFGRSARQGWLKARIWLGLTCENQKAADERITDLLGIDVAVHYVSLEPLLGQMDIKSYLWVRQQCAGPKGCGYEGASYEFDSKKKKGAFACPQCGKNHTYLVTNSIDWCIIGCETGSKRRPCKIEWVRDIIGQCDATGVPVFVKALEINGKISKDMAEWPEDLRRREYPTNETL